jgi:BirA family biotin operon repressor/biotin-[acetyl-CoA-carboxylase] ligase
VPDRPPPGAVLQRLVAGPLLVSRALWYDRIGSTNAEIARRAADGAAHGLLVLADEQVAGRGRQGRGWFAPAGTSLMGSLLLRPGQPMAHVALLSLLAGLALAEACEIVVPGAPLALKWPNDLLLGDRKAAGILVEVPADGVVVVGMGVNVDWRGVDRPAEVAMATSLAEVRGGPIDRWALLSALIGRFDHHYRRWCDDPVAFLPAYRDRCATLGRPVRVEQPGGATREGVAVAITDGGALVVAGDDGVAELHAGGVQHLRHH